MKDILKKIKDSINGFLTSLSATPKPVKKQKKVVKKVLKKKSKKKSKK